MRISDWSSDVCSSDLNRDIHHRSSLGRARSENQPLSSRTAAHLTGGRQPCLAARNFASHPSRCSLPRRSSPRRPPPRSEEHTSELQSLMRSSYAVFCLKKKKLYTTTSSTYYHS